MPSKRSSVKVQTSATEGLNFRNLQPDKMSFRSLLIFICFATLLVNTSSIIAQTEPSPETFKAIVLDERNQTPVPFATAKLIGTTGGVVADGDGRFDIPALNAYVDIEVSALGFKPAKIRLSRTDTLYQISLQPDNDLPLITVESKAKEIPVERKHITNFRVAFLTSWHDEVIVTYRRGMSNNHRLLRYDRDGNLLETLPIEIKELSAVTTRCSERLFLVTGKEAIIIDRVNNSMQAVEKISRKDYDILFAGCKLKREDHYVFEQRLYNGLLRKSSIQPTGKEPILFQVYSSPVLGNYFRDRYLIARNLATKDIENVDRNIHGILRGRQFFADFLENIMYNNDERNYYFLNQGQLICFDFASRQMRAYDWKGALLEEQSLPEKAGPHKFLDQIIQDPVSGRFYSWAKETNDHVLFEVYSNLADPSTAEMITVSTSEVAKLPLSRIDQLCILNGKIYASGKSSLDNQSAGPTLYTADLLQLP